MTSAASLGMPVEEAFGDGAVVGELDATTDRAGTTGGGVQLGGEPVGRHDRVRVGGRDEPVRAAAREQAGASGVHAHPPGVTRSGPRSVEEVQGEGGVCLGYLAGECLGSVDAGVEDQEHLVFVVPDVSCAARARRQAPTSSSSSRAGTTTHARRSRLGAGSVTRGMERGTSIRTLTLVVGLVRAVGQNTLRARRPCRT